MDVIEAEALALIHMEEHGLFDELWRFDFQSKKGALGTCSYRNKRISLSKWYVELNEEGHVEDTILHEIAHALSYIRHGSKGVGHGRIWKSICREIGAIPQSMSKNELNRPDNHYKYVDTCGCGKTFNKHRIRKNRRYSCPKCKEQLFITSKEKRANESSMRLLEDILGN